MAFCACYPRRTVGDIEFTVLLVHVLNVSHPAALDGSGKYAREVVVERFLRKYTNLSPVLVGEHAHKFLRLAADSRLEMTFVGKPHGFQAPSYKVYKYEVSEGLCVVFEVEVRIIRRFMAPGSVYVELEIERVVSLNIGQSGKAVIIVEFQVVELE
jgi:hypothetical protein